MHVQIMIWILFVRACFEVDCGHGLQIRAIRLSDTVGHLRASNLEKSEEVISRNSISIEHFTNWLTINVNIESHSDLQLKDGRRAFAKCNEIIDITPRGLST
jgi:hypothetical protein